MFGEDFILKRREWSFEKFNFILGKRELTLMLSTGEEKKLDTTDLVIIRKVSSQRSLLVLIINECNKGRIPR